MVDYQHLGLASLPIEFQTKLRLDRADQRGGRCRYDATRGVLLPHPRDREIVLPFEPGGVDHGGV